MPAYHDYDGILLAQHHFIIIVRLKVELDRHIVILSSSCDSMFSYYLHLTKCVFTRERHVEEPIVVFVRVV